MNPSKNKFTSAKHSGESFEYLYSEPELGEKAPVIFYIHGAGSKGTDISVLENNPAWKAVVQNAGKKSIVVAPQCHANTWFDLYGVLTEFIENILQKNNTDRNRVYIIGSSMGGYTVWQLIMSHPEWFTAAIPICGGGMYWNAGRLKNVKIWAFHGALDDLVLPEDSLHMVKAVNNAGGSAKLTIFPTVKHNAWDDALSLKETWNWLFQQEKKDSE